LPLLESLSWMLTADKLYSQLNSPTTGVPSCMLLLLTFPGRTSDHMEMA
jgi:hypothetical protein